MIGEPSLIAPASGADLAKTVQIAPDRGVRSPRPEVHLEDVGAGMALPRPGTADGQEAARLRNLLSDPAVRVSVHQDASSGHLVMQVEKRATGEMVEQIPSERLLRLYQSLRESLVDEQV